MEYNELANTEVWFMYQKIATANVEIVINAKSEDCNIHLKYRQKDIERKLDQEDEQDGGDIKENNIYYINIYYKMEYKVNLNDTIINSISGPVSFYYLESEDVSKPLIILLEYDEINKTKLCDPCLNHNGCYEISDRIFIKYGGFCGYSSTIIVLVYMYENY